MPPSKYSVPTSADTKVDDNSRNVKLLTIIITPDNARIINTEAIVKMPNFNKGNLRIMPLADSPYIAQAKKHNAIITVMIYGKATPKVVVYLFIISAIP